MDEPELGVLASVAMTAHAPLPAGPVSKTVLVDETDDTATRPKLPPTQAGALAREVPKAPKGVQY